MHISEVLGLVVLTKMFKLLRPNKEKQLQVEAWEVLVAAVSLEELLTNSTNNAQSASSMARTQTTSMG